jgi:D-glycero-alpha-D-manno-heptose 1-phosphate guanylyltransferase
MSSVKSIIPLILAGGRGTRIAHLRPDVPKPAVQVAGRPFLCWILEQLSEAGYEQVVVSGGHLAEVLEREVSMAIPEGMSVRWVHETEPLGTAGGAAHAKRLSGWESPYWLVLNGDSYLGGCWPSKISVMKGPSLVARKIDEASRYGSLQVTDGTLAGFQEKSAVGPGLINAGIYLLPEDWLGEIPSGVSASMEQEMIPRWIASGRKLHVLEEKAPFIDIGTPETLAEADAFFHQPEILGRS